MDGDRGAARREEATAAMLAAAERLFAERGFAAVSVRQIAAAAGVSHALVHRYLGSKNDILRAVLKSHENAIRDAADGAGDLSDAMALMLRAGLERHKDYLRLIIQSSLQGVPFEETMGGLPAGEQLARMAEEVAATRPGHAPGDPLHGVTPRFAITAVIALYLGWVASEDWLLKAMDLDHTDEEALVAQLESVLRGIISRNILGESD
jgi:AcrR family transcriptional regulator